MKVTDDKEVKDPIVSKEAEVAPDGLGEDSRPIPKSLVMRGVKEVGRGLLQGGKG